MRESNVLRCFQLSFFNIIAKFYHSDPDSAPYSGSVFGNRGVKESAQIRIRNHLLELAIENNFYKTWVTVPFTVEEANSVEVAQSPSTHSRTTERFSVQAWTPQITNFTNFWILIFCLF
jgi:hypothetical protein